MANNLFARSLHDLGAAGWFGSVLMGAVAVNRAPDDVDDPVARGKFVNGVWRRWWPVNALCVGAHVIGSTRVASANTGRLVAQRGVGRTSVIKTIVTGAAVGCSVYAGMLGKRISDAGDVPMANGTEPTGETPADVARALEHQAVLQWVIPALTGLLIVLGAKQGEQQRPVNVAHGIIDRVRR